MELSVVDVSDQTDRCPNRPRPKNDRL